ncbi:muconate/chloromuconate family cycloisomerase [Neisseria leonii]|uniref:muconate/chloromuconate family cycloisomerase n=1 Tax=Neisseria leonii TaxID=2995413 RepID=UPI00237C0C1F|nr:muconate/chloromuconate family cycloisomerase [Neisseria sp. 3986]MDD9325041.1 muconate/chloromuconate family cycloisomerase [Neisseria sp. 3986]
MNKIDSIDTLLVDIPTIRTHKLSMTTMSVQTLVLVRMRFSDGIESWGEATTIGGLNYGEESPESIKTNIDRYFTPLLLNARSANPAQAMQLLNHSIRGNRFAKCAVETALLDAEGQRLGLPLSELLGGRLHDSLPVLWVLASGDTAKDIAEAEKMIEARRHNIFKLKIGLRPIEEDVAHAVAVKKALGSNISIRVDVNQAWNEQQAEKGIAMLQDGGIDLVEQPVAAHNRAALARLSARFSTAVMADETLCGPYDVLTLATAHTADVFSIKINQSGGITAAKLAGQVADLSGAALYGGTMLEGAVGTAASAHVFSTFPHIEFGTELFGPLLLTEEILSEPLIYRDFRLQVPNAPGLGIKPDTEKIETLKRA